MSWVQVTVGLCANNADHHTCRFDVLIICLCVNCAALECQLVLTVKEGMLEIRRGASGQSLQLCTRHHPHVLHPFLWHLHLLHVSEEIQDQPVLSYYCK